MDSYAAALDTSLTLDAGAGLDTAIFDMDGTLLDYDRSFETMWTTELLRRFGRAQKDHALADISGPAVEQYLRMPMPQREQQLLSWGYASMRQFLNGWNTEEVYAAKEAYLTCYPDTYILEYLRTHGFKLGIVTSAPESLARREMRVLEAKHSSGIINELVIASHESGIPMKPAPDGIVTCLSRLASSRSTAFYVGNEDADMQAAQAAGVIDILIDRGRVTTSSTTSRRITSLDEIKMWLEAERGTHPNRFQPIRQ
jgi:phosphoglycolate phosphatase-like HAD superfamily hydrolase